MELPSSLLRKDPIPSNDDAELTEAQKMAMSADLTKAARFTMLSMPRQTIGRLALKYDHVGSAHLKAIARPTMHRILYGPAFAEMHRFTQTYVMARESLRHALGHIHMGAVQYKRGKTGFSFKVWSMACDSVINNVLENLPKGDEASTTLAYGVRRCEELGVVKWDDVCREMRRISRKHGIDLPEIFDKNANELSSTAIYQAIMKVVRQVCDIQKTQDRRRSWTDLVTVLDALVERAVADPDVPIKADPVELGALELYDALARLVRIYNESAYPSDHDGAGPIDVEDWKLLSEAVKALIAKAIEDPAHSFTAKPRRRSVSLWNDLVSIVRAFTDFEDEDEVSEEGLIDEIAEEINLVETLREAIEEAAEQPEGSLVNEASQREMDFRRAQAGAGHGDALLQIAPPGGATRTPWRKALASMASSALITRFSIDPTRPSRRSVLSMYEARFRGDGRARTQFHNPRINRHAKAKKAVFIIDTSGSIFSDRETVEHFLREAMTVCRRVNTVLTVIFADDGVSEIVQVGEAYETIRTLQPKGGGGTDFRPAIRAAEAMGPDLIIYATDLMGTFPSSKPSCPIIWGFPPEFEHIETPFGQRLPLIS